MRCTQVVLVLTMLCCTPHLAAQTNIETVYFKNGCNACHGNYGEGIGTAPRLQGVDAQKLYRRLKRLQAGKTRTPFGTVMITFARSLDENQTRAMAEWLSNLQKKEPEQRYESDDFFDNTGDGAS